MMRPRTLITGGAGFVGSHLCDRLIQEGHEVICLDNLLTGRIANIQHLIDHPRFHIVAHDATMPIYLDKLVSIFASRLPQDIGGALRLNNVLHFASPASPKDYQRHPIHTLKVGAIGTLNALGLARRCHSVFLLASTSEVYGDPEVSPQTEAYMGRVNPIGLRSVYDEAKRYAEALATAYEREHGSQVRIARIFNTYGERMRSDDGRALPNFITQALQDMPVTVYGMGTQTRSLCYVSDLVDGIIRLLSSNERGPVNIGNPEEITLLDLARLVIKETGSKSSIVFEPLPSDDPQVRKPDISRAIGSLNWHPQVTLREGLRRVIPYFKNELLRSPQALSGRLGLPPDEKAQASVSAP